MIYEPTKFCSNEVFLDSIRIHCSECPLATDTNGYMRFFCLLSATIRNVEQHVCRLLTRLIHCLPTDNYTQCKKKTYD
jgi:hypothetical protein